MEKGPFVALCIAHTFLKFAAITCSSVVHRNHLSKACSQGGGRSRNALWGCPAICRGCSCPLLYFCAVCAPQALLALSPAEAECLYCKLGWSTFTCQTTTFSAWIFSGLLFRWSISPVQLNMQPPRHLEVAASGKRQSAENTGVSCSVTCWQQKWERKRKIK